MKFPSKIPIRFQYSNSIIEQTMDLFILVLVGAVRAPQVEPQLLILKLISLKNSDVL